MSEGLHVQRSEIGMGEGMVDVTAAVGNENVERVDKAGRRKWWRLEKGYSVGEQRFLVK